MNFKRNIVICALCIGITSSFRNDDNVVALHEGSIFREDGHLYTHLSWAHLVIKIDINNLIQRKNMLIEVRDRILDLTEDVHPTTKKSFFNRKTREAIKWMQSYLNTTITNGIDRITTTLKSFEYEETNLEGGVDHRSRRTVELTRKKRQIVAGAIALGLGYVIASVVSKFRTETLIKAIQQQQDVISSRVEDDMVRINQIEHDVAAINKTMDKIKEVTHQLVHKMENVEATEMAIITVLSLSDTMNQIIHITSALEKARDGTFSMDLAEAKGVMSAVNKIEKKGVQEGRKLGIRNLMDITHCQTSYVYNYTAASIYVIPHLPMYLENSYYTLYHFVTTPARMEMTNKKTMFVEVEAEETYLALSRDNRKYAEYTNHQLSQCLNFGNTYFCKEQVNYYRKRKSCITAIYDNDQQGINHLCRLTITDQVSLAMRLNETSFLVTETAPQILTMTCNNGNEKYEIEGTYIITVKKGCIASTENFAIERPNFESEVEISQMVLNRPINLLNHLEMEEARMLMETADEFISHVGEKLPMSTVKGLAKFKSNLLKAKNVPFWEALTSLMPGSLLSSFLILLGTAMLIGIAILSYRCYTTRGNRIAEPGVGYRRHHSSIELNFRQEQPRRPSQSAPVSPNRRRSISLETPNRGLVVGVTPHNSLPTPPASTTSLSTLELAMLKQDSAMDPEVRTFLLHKAVGTKVKKQTKPTQEKIEAFYQGLNQGLPGDDDITLK